MHSRVPLALLHQRKMARQLRKSHPQWRSAATRLSENAKLTKDLAKGKH